MASLLSVAFSATGIGRRRAVSSVFGVEDPPLRRIWVRGPDGFLLRARGRSRVLRRPQVARRSRRTLGRAFRHHYPEAESERDAKHRPKSVARDRRRSIFGSGVRIDERSGSRRGISRLFNRPCLLDPDPARRRKYLMRRRSDRHPAPAGRANVRNGVAPLRRHDHRRCHRITGRRDGRTVASLVAGADRWTYIGTGVSSIESTRSG